MNWPLEFERCLDKRGLVKMPEAGYLVTKELEVALDDLAEAEGGYKRGGYKWSIVQSTSVDPTTASSIVDPTAAAVDPTGAAASTINPTCLGFPIKGSQSASCDDAADDDFRPFFQPI